MFGLFAIFTPRGPARAFTIDIAEGLALYGKNGTFFGIGFEGTRQVVKDVISSIPNLQTRAVVSTTASIVSMTAGVGCTLGMAGCSDMGWEQKALVCAQGLGVCAGVAAGLHQEDPSNPATMPGKIASDAATAFTQQSA